MAKSDHGRDLSGAEMAQMLEEFCNANAFSRKEVAAFVERLTKRTHRTLQQSVMRLFVKCIEAWASETNFDDRNAATVKLCKKIIEATGDQYDRHLPTI